MRKIFCFILTLTFCGFTQSNYFDNIYSWYCDVYECCDIERIPYKIQNLKTMIYDKLQGQHIVKDIVLNAINSHVRKSTNKKPLVMSFHGSNGVGKTFVSRMIAQAFYEKGENSNFFHFYYGLQNFPDKLKISEYQDNLKSDIEAALRKCEKSLFVFDGVDQIPAKLLDVLMPFIDCTNCIENLEKNKSIFIFLTNTGSLAIQKQLLKKINNGVKRESTTIQDFEKVITEATIQGKGGLFESLIIQSDAIDFYIPFLPLEREHVKYCIKVAFEELNISPTTFLIEKVLEEIRFGPEPDNLFSNGGCKRVAVIAGRIAAKLQPDFDDFASKTEL